MKASDRRQYIDALVEHARRKTLGASLPVVVHVYRFFSEACERSAIPHAFSPGDTKSILSKFDADFRDSSYSGDGEGYPIYVMAVGKGVLSLCGHGKQAIVDTERTPQAYVNACTISGKNGKECWALFGPDASRQHPMIKPTFATEKKRLETSVTNFEEKTSWVPDGSIKIDVGRKLIAN